MSLSLAVDGLRAPSDAGRPDANDDRNMPFMHSRWRLRWADRIVQLAHCPILVVKSHMSHSGARRGASGLLELDIRCLDHATPPLNLLLHVPRRLLHRAAKSHRRQFLETVL